MFFFFFFSSLFCPSLQRPLFPTCRVLKPPPLHRASPLKPRKSRRRHCLIRRHASKDMFFFLFFVPFLTNVTETLFTPHAGTSNPRSPPHNPYPHVPPLKPRKSPPPSPRRTQAVTSASPLHHAQVRWHHPVTVRKTRRDTASTPSQHGVQARLRRQPAPRKPRHGATPMRRASPATALTRRTRAPPRRASPTTTPTRRAKTS